MKTQNIKTKLKALVGTLFICFAYSTTAISAENNNTLNNSIPEINSSEKEIEIEGWMLNLADWNSSIKAQDSTDKDLTIATENKKSQAIKLIQKEIQIAEFEKDIELENWMTDLSSW